jgi:hypothetical protein
MEGARLNRQSGDCHAQGLQLWLAESEEAPRSLRRCEIIARLLERSRHKDANGAGSAAGLLQGVC